MCTTPLSSFCASILGPDALMLLVWSRVQVQAALADARCGWDIAKQEMDSKAQQMFCTSDGHAVAIVAQVRCGWSGTKVCEAGMWTNKPTICFIVTCIKWGCLSNPVSGQTGVRAGAAMQGGGGGAQAAVGKG